MDQLYRKHILSIDQPYINVHLKVVLITVKNKELKISQKLKPICKNNVILELSAPNLPLNRFHLTCQRFFVDLCNQ